MCHLKDIPTLMNFKFLIIASGFLLTCFFSNAQMVLLEEDVAADTVAPTTGPNRTNFGHFYLSYGVPIADVHTGADIYIGRSFDFDFGYRYKRKLSRHYALGFEVFYKVQDFNLKQDSGKIVPDTILHDKERLRFNNLGIGIYNRFNFGKRGDVVGNFIDIGVYGSWAYRLANITKDELPNGNKVRTKITKLDYYEPINYGVVARIGFNRYVFYGTYRLSNLFKASSNYPELPFISAGIQIGLH